MSPNVRTACAIVGGVLLAGLTIALVEAVGHSLTGSDPAMAFVAALIGYALGATVGAGVAKRLAAHGNTAAWTVIGLLAVLALINLFAITHPWWFAPAAVTIFAGIGWMITRRTAT